MKITTLENVDTGSLAETFNLSFSDYLVPFKITKEQLERKIKTESIDLRFSAGAFEDDRLIGFILHGIDHIHGNKVAYNAGTGVIPDERGNKITSKLMEYIIPKLKEQNVTKLKLEVITGNQVAINTYERAGFKITRDYNCYKGQLKTHSGSRFEIRPLLSDDWQLFSSFWDGEPAWQNSVTAMKNAKELHIAIGIFSADQLIGYLIYNPDNHRIHQFAVAPAYRRQGAAKQLFEYISSGEKKEFSVINIDKNLHRIHAFLLTVGYELTIKQYEMELNIS
ncbi:hypothetical protein TH53_00945 [Pedobacter lusitanus]|uniref:N-acetyltransferase domain-containing protein n=1 Tax=Pedobacter lusitanus TaxID=1503925 RepID=A0A0D0GNV1_9SPHI|nr:GNAT family N-acetyltransferase [Pedobacter lusitanus]KIO78907.1 hypothetical protein TH53_00945 [Pedobacter lusitanus]